MSDILKRLREPAALAALAYAGLTLLAAVIDFLFPPSAAGVSQAFGDRAFNDVGSFLNFSVAAAIAIAVLLANDIAPQLARARLITLAALIEAGVAAVFGVICALALFGANAVSGDETFAQFLAAIGGGFLIAVAGWYSWLSWQRHAAAAAPAQPAGNEWNAAGQAGQAGGYAPPYQAQPSSGQFGQGAAGGSAQQPAGAPPGGFGWSPQQSYNPGAAGGAQGGVPQQQPFRGDDRTQMIQPISSQQQGQGQQPYQAQGAQQGGQNFQQPEAQPWSPGGASPSGDPGQQGQQGQQQPPQQQPTQEQRENPFGIGDWRSE
jgi:hypothetical protein